MAVIIEGPDASGKSTLARTLAKQFGMNHVTSAGAPKGAEQVLAYCKTQLEDCKKRQSVLDRVTPISHPIYDPSWVGCKWLDDTLEWMLNHPETVLVYCRPPTDALMRPEKHSWKSYDTEEHKQLILNNQHIFIQRYDAFFQKHSHIAYDYTQSETTDVNMELIAMIAASQMNDECLRLLRELMHAGKMKAIFTSPTLPMIIPKAEDQTKTPPKVEDPTKILAKVEDLTKVLAKVEDQSKTTPKGPVK